MLSCAISPGSFSILAVRSMLLKLICMISACQPKSGQGSSLTSSLQVIKCLEADLDDGVLASIYLQLYHGCQVRLREQQPVCKQLLQSLLCFVKSFDSPFTGSAWGCMACRHRLLSMLRSDARAWRSIGLVPYRLSRWSVRFKFRRETMQQPFLCNCLMAIHVTNVNKH